MRLSGRIVTRRAGLASALIALSAALGILRGAAGALSGLTGEPSIPALAESATASVQSPAVHSARGSAESLEQAFVDVAERIGPAVVSVEATYTIVQRFSPWGDEFFDDFFRRFFEEAPETQRRQPVRSLGSGVIVTPDGYILTNAHVIGEAKNVTVRLLNKREYRARIIGRDEGTDLAVLKIDPEGGIVAAALGDSDAIKVGQWAIAIGNPFALENTVTVGVISAKGRHLDPSGGGAARYTSFIQTDASINRGNSGGPLLNLKGEVIGINTMIYSTSGGSIGIGFAIPSNIAKQILAGIIKEGRFIRPQMGITYRPLGPQVARKLGLPAGTGMEVTGVMAGSAADTAGIKPADIILSVDGKPLREVDDLRNAVLGHQVGDALKVELFRRGKRVEVSVVLKEEQRAKPEEGQARRGTATPRGGEEAWLGMTVVEMTAEMAQELNARNAEGIVVVVVAPESAAAEAGIMKGDIIREVEQQAVKNLAEFRVARKRATERDGVLILIERQGSTMYAVVNPARAGRPQE